MPKSFAVHLDRPPAIQIRKGVVKVIDYTAGARIERAMAVADLHEYVERGKRALERYASGDQDITEGG